MITAGPFDGMLCVDERLIHGPDATVCEQCGGELRPVKFSVSATPTVVARNPHPPADSCGVAAPALPKSDLQGE